jgi:flagellar assembly factor FliW
VIIQSDQLGSVDIDESKILSFDDGLLGFPDITRFAVVDAGDDGTYFWLQAVDDPQLAFLVAVPWAFFPDYAPVLSDADQDALALTDAADATLFCLLTITDDGVTANLLGPLVVNTATRQGRQVVLGDSDYSTRTTLAAA